MDGYRTILVAVIGAIAQFLGIQFDIDAVVQSVITLATLGSVIYFKIQANKREDALKTAKAIAEIDHDSY